MKRLAVLLTLLLAGAGATTASAQPDEQLRAFWVDAFNEGIYSPEQVDELVADASAANANVLIVQVGRRFDCFCNDAVYPRTDAAIDPAPYDPLATLIDRAHDVGLEVDAWINATTLWNQATPPSSPDHAFNRHGPTATGGDRWLNKRMDGSERIGNNAYLDPAHPDAVAHVVDAVRSVITNYDVDGVNFDYIRYPDHNGDAFRNDWGYGDVSLARFHAATGRTDVPPPDDEQFSDWRRAQVSNLVRQLYLGAFEEDPSVRVSANTISYAYGPQTYGGWEQTRPYANVMQDWRAWMEEGILDLNVNMNYKREWLDDQARMYDEWAEVIADWQYDRQAIVGSALYLNEVDDTLAQVDQALTATSAGNTAVGWTGYSYANPSLTGLGQPDDVRDAERDRLTAALTDPDGGPFAEAATVPEMTWKTSPTTGHVAGVVSTDEGTVADQVGVSLVDPETEQVVDTILTDGNGWFGFVDVAPGRWKVEVDPAAVVGKPVTIVSLEAGELANGDIRVKRLR